MPDLPEKVPTLLFLGVLFFTYACVPVITVPSETAANTPTSNIHLPTISGTPTPVETSTPLSIPSKTPVPPTSSPVPTRTVKESSKGINPLTGLEVKDPELLNRRPIAVKVQLFPRGQRPPYGISKADIVFDYYQNNGVTRLTAVFYGDNASQTGPIRSARLFDLDIIKMYNAFFAFGLADWRIYERLKRSAFSDRLVVEKYGSCPPLCRVDPEGYNHLLLDTSGLPEYFSDEEMSNARQELVGYEFDEFPPQNGISAQVVNVRTSRSAYNRWDFDPHSGQYLRFQDSLEGTPEEEEFEPLLDQINGEQIAADNVIILFLAHRYAYQTHAGDKEVFKIRFTGNGEAKAFRDGQMYHLHWRRDDSDAPLELVFPDGTPYSLKPGNTWFQLIGKNSTSEQIEDGMWRFEFKVP